MFDLFQSIIDQSKKGYHDYHVSIEDVLPDGLSNPLRLPFHWVGRNSSHEFAISILKDGRIVYLAEGGYGDHFERSCHICKPGREPTYFGHW